MSERELTLSKVNTYMFGKNNAPPIKIYKNIDVYIR